MARFLSRLGLHSAQHPFRIIFGWLLLLLLAGGGFLLSGGQLSSSFSIPGTETDRVNQELSTEFPELSGAMGTVVAQSENGSGFSEQQQAGLAALIAELQAVEGVGSVINPFETEAMVELQHQQLAGGAQQIAGARPQLEAAQLQLDQGREALDAGQLQLDQAIEQAKLGGYYDAMKAQFDQQQAALDAGYTPLNENQAALDEQVAMLDAQEQQIILGQQLLEYSAAMRTVSEDGNTALIAVLFISDIFSLDEAVKIQVQDILNGAEISGVTIDYSTEISQTTQDLLGISEIVGVAIAAIVLLIMFGTLLPAMVPLFSAVAGVGIGVAGALSLSGIIEMSSISSVLGVMLGLAVGIDYSLFIINRHRRQLREGAELYDSIALANGTAGNAVVFAGSTVLIALLALNVTGIPFLGIMGSVGAFVVLVAVLISVTLTPALLGLLKEKVLPKKARKERAELLASQTIADTAARTASATTGVTPAVEKKTPAWKLIAAIAGSAAVLITVALPALDLRLGLPDGSSQSKDSTAYRAFTAIADNFGEGLNTPIVVTVQPEQAIAEENLLQFQADLAGVLMAQENVVGVAPVAANSEGTFFAFQLIPSEGPASESTENLVHALRDLTVMNGDVTLGVAGQASGNIDISEMLSDVLPLYLVIVIGLSLIIMTVVFRSLLVPVVATAGFVLSLFASLGGVVAIYQWGWLGEVFGVHTPAPVLNFVPIILMGVLFGLAMDYQLFIGSGIREAYVHGQNPTQAVRSGVRAGRTVVTAAAIIMVSVFGGFIFSHMATIRPIGFALAFGVLLDAFVIRMFLIPAVLQLAGASAWYLPKWLDRILPDVDVEGSSLERNRNELASVPAAEQLVTGAEASVETKP